MNEVVAELDESDFEDSEDDFDGYLDMESDNEAHTSEKRDSAVKRDEGRSDIEDVLIRTNREIGSDGSTEQCIDFPHEYTLQPGCSASVNGDSPLEYFLLLFDQTMLEHIVHQTNLNAQQYMDTQQYMDLAPHSRVRRWAKGVHNMNELRRFLAIIIVMELVRNLQIESH